MRRIVELSTSGSSSAAATISAISSALSAVSQREAGIEADRPTEVGVLVGGEDEPKEEDEDLVGLSLAVERALGEIAVAVGQRLDGLPAHRTAGVFESLQKVIEREILRVGRTPDRNTLGGLLDDAQPHQLCFGLIDRVDVFGVKRIGVHLDVDNPSAQHVLGDDRPLNGAGIEIVGVDHRLAFAGACGLREHGERSLSTHPDRDLIAFFNVVFLRPLRRQRHRQC